MIFVYDIACVEKSKHGSTSALSVMSEISHADVGLTNIQTNWLHGAEFFVRIEQFLKKSRNFGSRAVWAKPLPVEITKESHPSYSSFSHDLWRWNRHSVPKHWHIIFRHWVITQKKEYNIQNVAEVWKQEWKCMFCSVSVYFYSILLTHG